MLVFVALSAAFPLYNGPVAYAADPCTILPADIHAITAAQAQGLAAELAARKALLTRVIAYANTDTEVLTAQLQGMTVDDGAATLQSQLEGKLADAMNY